MNNFESGFQFLVDKIIDQHDREFEMLITNFVVKKEEKEQTSLKKFLRNELEGEDYTRSYIAFLCLATLYRRAEETPYLNVLFHDYQDKFKSQLLFYHFRALKYKSENKYIEGLGDSRKALDNPKLSEQSGVLHAYAETAVTLLEDKNHLSEEHLSHVLSIKDDAFQKLEKAIEKEKYAKFYGTKARFFIYDKKYKEAKSALKMAIDLEEKGNDYQLRIARYYQLLSIVQVKEEITKQHMDQELYNKNINSKMEQFNAAIRKKMEEFNQKIDNKLIQQEMENKEHKNKTEEMIDEMKRGNLQMLGFFTAIISFTVGSFQIIKEQSFLDAALLLMILGGVLLIAYAGFSYSIFYRSKRDHVRPNIIILLLGIFLIGFSILAYQQGWMGEVMVNESYKDLQNR